MAYSESLSPRVGPVNLVLIRIFRIDGSKENKKKPLVPRSCLQQVDGSDSYYLSLSLFIP